MNWDDIEEVVLTSHQQPSQTEVIDDKLAIWKSQVISALINNTFLSPLHGKLATKAEPLTSLNSLYFYHPHNEIDFEIKEIMAITISNWYTEYRATYPATIKPKEEILTIHSRLVTCDNGADFPTCRNQFSMNDSVMIFSIQTCSISLAIKSIVFQIYNQLSIRICGKI